MSYRRRFRNRKPDGGALVKLNRGLLMSQPFIVIMPSKRILCSFGIDVDAVAGW
jgi:hypothetical protein